ncbi:nitrile hydratase subunit beta [Primorskyibacter sp. S187A]|uniref:nitrile hydratase subunit beta n=1 Tax=Primorskyibacter sp. S187A TaxID=3415130 RepID=UPI003C7C5BC5
MSRIHDMGGRYGDGPVTGTEDDRVFHADWHGRAMAITVASGSIGAWSIDTSRHARESLPPKDYARFSYYEKWMAGMANLLVAKGIATPQDFTDAAEGKPAAVAGALHEKALRAEDVSASQRRLTPYTRDSDRAPRFAVGDIVQTRAHSPNTAVPGGHTRLPQYAMGRRGKIVLHHGTHVLPDSNAHGLGEAPEPLYAVAFTARELWGDVAEAPDDVMVLDLWESYLLPATE